MGTYRTEKSYVTAIFRHIRNRSKIKDLPLSLTQADFLEIIKKDCHYCGAKPRVYGGKDNQYVKFKSNGIDRIDHDKGYSKRNCLPCCTTCNFMRRTMSIKEFIKKIGEIHEFYSKKAADKGVKVDSKAGKKPKRRRP